MSKSAQTLSHQSLSGRGKLYLISHLTMCQCHFLANSPVAQPLWFLGGGGDKTPLDV